MKIPSKSRSSLKGDAAEALREMNDQILSERNYPSLNFGIYSNEGGHGSMKLPPAGSHQQYYEGRSSATRSGGAGRYRFVFLVQGEPKKNADDPKPLIVQRYYTEDHYQNFYVLEDS